MSTTALGECGTADVPCVVELRDSQWSETLAALAVLVFCALAFLVGSFGRGRET